MKHCHPEALSRTVVHELSRIAAYESFQNGNLDPVPGAVKAIRADHRARSDWTLSKIRPGTAQRLRCERARLVGSGTPRSGVVVGSGLVGSGEELAWRASWASRTWRG